MIKLHLRIARIVVSRGRDFLKADPWRLFSAAAHLLSEILNTPRRGHAQRVTCPNTRSPASSGARSFAPAVQRAVLVACRLGSSLRTRRVVDCGNQSLVCDLSARAALVTILGQNAANAKRQKSSTEERARATERKQLRAHRPLDT